MLSHVWLFVNPWTVARQVLLSMESSRQEYWSQSHFLLQGIFPTQGLNPSPALAGRFFTTILPRKPSNLTQLSESLSSWRKKGFMVCSWPKDKWDNVTVIFKDHLRPPWLVSCAQQSDSVLYVVEDRETWHAAVQVFTKSQMQLSNWRTISMYMCIHIHTDTHTHIGLPRWY